MHHKHAGGGENPAKGAQILLYMLVLGRDSGVLWSEDEVSVVVEAIPDQGHLGVCVLRAVPLRQFKVEDLGGWGWGIRVGGLGFRE